MRTIEENATATLFEKDLIKEEQMEQIIAHRSLKIFSLHNELRLLLYISVLSFTTGIGMLIYKNIESIGHIAILSLILIITAICFYFSFKNAKGFKKTQTAFEKPVLDYVILTAVLLTCIFIGYLQYQYTAFGTQYGLATLIPTTIAFFSAYYFDNKSTLSIAITGLAAYVGLTVSPETLVNNNFYESNTLSYTAILLGVVLAVWTTYSSKIDLKKHFNLIYLTFSLHLISISCINNLFESHWGVFAVLLTASSYYFYKSSYHNKSVSLFASTILYSYIGANILIFKILELIKIEDLLLPFFFMVPLYFICSIVLFIRLIKKFNTYSKNDSIQ